MPSPHSDFHPWSDIGHRVPASDTTALGRSVGGGGAAAGRKGGWGGGWGGGGVADPVGEHLVVDADLAVRVEVALLAPLQPRLRAAAAAAAVAVAAGACARPRPPAHGGRFTAAKSSGAGRARPMLGDSEGGCARAAQESRGAGPRASLECVARGMSLLHLRLNGPPWGRTGRFSMKCDSRRGTRCRNGRDEREMPISKVAHRRQRRRSPGSQGSTPWPVDTVVSSGEPENDGKSFAGVRKERCAK